MDLRFVPYTLQLKHAFTLATSSRSTTPAMLVEVEKDGIIGYGEAAMPPYLGETQKTASAFFSRLDLAQYNDPFAIEEILQDVDAVAPGNHAAKAAVDIALHDWVGKKMGYAWHRIWGLNVRTAPVTSFTIAINDVEGIRARVREAEEYRILKVKLGRENDRAIITTVREMTDKPIRVDVNGGWVNRENALKMIEWLAARDVELVEQPMPKEQIDDLAWLKERSPLKLVGDEGVQRLTDVRKAYGVYDGINIKLMKCTGMHEAHKMILLARALDMKVMLGCMTETSCAISAAAQLSPMADWADLDGALLINNDPFRGASMVNGRILVSSGAGIGVMRIGN